MKVHIKVWTTDLKECETFVLRVSEAAFLDDRPKGMPPSFMVPFIAKLEDLFPGNTFRVVPIGNARYNVIPEVIHRA